MDFLTKFIPFYNFPNDWLNSIIITTTLFVFLYYLNKYVKRINNEFNKISAINLDPNILISLEKNYKEEVNNYKKNLISIDNKTKSTQSFNKYFNLGVVLAKLEINVQLLQSIPSKLVGLGILGTFVGLTYGISGFNTNSQETIKNSISTLLNGMGTAFVTSIYGMVLSLLFSYIEKKTVDKLKKEIFSICDKIDDEYLITKEDEIELETKKIETTLNKYFCIRDSKGEIIKPGKILYELYFNTSQQTEALKSFSTDLAEKIEAGFETILSKQFETSIAPLIENIYNELINLRNSIKNPTDEMTTNVVKDLENALRQMIMEFNGNLVSNAKNEFENIIISLDSIVNVINDIPNYVKKTIDDMSNTINILSLSLNKNISDIQATQKLLIEKQINNIETTDLVLEDIKSTLNEMRKSAESLESANDSLTNTLDSLKNINKFMHETTLKNEENVNKVIEMGKDLQHFINTFMERNEQLLNQIIEINESSLVKMQSTIKGIIDELVIVSKSILVTTSNTSKEYQTIKEGLISIFEQIDKGITDYQIIIHSSLKENLNTYSESVKNSVESLKDIVNGLYDLLSELNETVGKFGNKVMR